MSLDNGFQNVSGGIWSPSQGPRWNSQQWRWNCTDPCCPPVSAILLPPPLPHPLVRLLQSFGSSCLLCKVEKPISQPLMQMLRCTPALCISIEPQTYTWIWSGAFSLLCFAGSNPFPHRQPWLKRIKNEGMVFPFLNCLPGEEQTDTESVLDHFSQTVHLWLHVIYSAPFSHF